MAESTPAPDADSWLLERDHVIPLVDRIVASLPHEPELGIDRIEAEFVAGKKSS